MKDKSYINLGWFDSITQVWELHPEGGHEGEYFYVDSQKYRWNKTTRNWEYAATDPVAGGNFVVGNDLTVNNNALVGNDLRVHGNANVEKNLFVGGKIYAKGIKQPNCGFFSSEEALKAAYPTPEVGMWASVGNTMPGTVWRCETAGVWINTGQTGGVDPTDVNYGIVNNLESESTTEALSAAMGAKLQDEKLGVVPQGLTEDQKRQAQANMGMDKIIDGLRKRTGYFVCSTPWSVSSKVVTAPNFELYPGCCIKIKMIYHNEEASPTLNINNTGPRLLYFDNVIGSKGNTWRDGEVIEVYYNGEFYYSNSIGGNDAVFKTGQRVRDLGIDKVPTKDSENLVESGGVYDAIEDLQEDFDELLENYKPIIINGDVVNAPDEEDITMDEEFLLKFKDRGTLFGRGYVILRREKTVSEQMTKDDTIYEIRYDFDLNGEEIQIPENCVLKFNGGKISNGRLISNKTVLEGSVIEDNSDSLFGVFYDSSGRVLGWDKHPIGDWKSSIEYGDFNINALKDFPNLPDTSTQSMLMTETHVFIFFDYTLNGNYTNTCCVWDRNYNYVGGSTIIGVSHANDATYKGDYIYLANGTAANTGVLKIHIPTLISNCQNNVDTSAEYIRFGTQIVSIDYDPITDTFGTNDGSKLNIYNTSFELISEGSNFFTQTNAIAGRDCTQQGLVYQNGIAYIFNWDHYYSSGDSGSSGAIISIYDVPTKEVVLVQPLCYPTTLSETEGVCKDPLTGTVYGVVFHGSYFAYRQFTVQQYTYGLKSVNNSTKLGATESLILNDNKRSPIYVDNTYTGKSNGSKINPYKSLGEALTCGYKRSERTEITLVNTGVPYFNKITQISDSSFRIAGDSGKVVLNTTFNVVGTGFLILANIDIKPTAECYPASAVLTINQNANVRFLGTASIGIEETSHSTLISVSNGGKLVVDQGAKFYNSNSSLTYSDVIAIDVNIADITLQGGQFTNVTVLNCQTGYLPYVFINQRNVTLNNCYFVKGNFGMWDRVVLYKVDNEEQLAQIASLALISDNETCSFVITSNLDLENGNSLKAGKYFFSDHTFKSESDSQQIGYDGFRGYTARPEETRVGRQWYDRTLGIPIWWTGARWINAIGENADGFIKVLAFGDSLTNAVRNGRKSYMAYVTSDYKNIGVSGATISTANSSATTIPNQIIEESEYSPDVVIGQGGLNDYIYGATLGAIPTAPVTDDTAAAALDLSTVTGALQMALYTMVKKYPDAQRFWFVCHRINDYPSTQDTGGYTLTELCEAIKQVCELYSVVYIDIFNRSFINTAFSQYKAPTHWDGSWTDEEKAAWNAAYYVDSDGLHPTDKGYKEGFAPIIKQYIKYGTKKASE